jgi:hypothetical protein
MLLALVVLKMLQRGVAPVIIKAEETRKRRREMRREDRRM